MRTLHPDERPHVMPLKVGTFHETTAEGDANLERSTADLCPRAGRRDAIYTAVRCYGCTHLFDPSLSRNDVLCPCCA
jgi:hypothetical protein